MVGLDAVDHLNRHWSKSTASLIALNSCQVRNLYLGKEVVQLRLGKYTARIFRAVLQDRFKVEADLVPYN